MPLASIVVNFMNGWVEPVPPVVLPLPFTGDVGNANRNGTVSDANREAVIGTKNRKGTIT